MKENSRAKNEKFLYILKKECLSENDIRIVIKSNLMGERGLGKGALPFHRHLYPSKIVVLKAWSLDLPP